MQQTERLLYRPREVAQMLGLGLTKTYEMLAAGQIPSVRVGGSIRVPADELRAYMERLKSNLAATGS